MSKMSRQLVVSVAPGSMKPKDEVSEMNQAMELYKAGVLDPKTLLTRLNFPDPQKTAEQAVLWMVDKMTYMQLNFPEMAVQVQQAQQQAMAMQQQAQQAQMEQQGQAAQQQMEVQGAQAQQGMSIKEQEHQQKLAHNEQAFTQKQEMQKKALATKPKVINNKKK
jgi:hypothetical protein